MLLNFIGSGSALNTELGNNNAFMKKEQSLMLIDCGSTTFSRMQNTGLLDGVNNLYVLVTHRHPDHISSLGDLIFYAHFILKTTVYIFTPDAENVTSLLKYMGVEEELYVMNKLSGPFRIDDDALKLEIDYLEVPHVDHMKCFGYIINDMDTKLYYSGDSMDVPKAVLDSFQSKDIKFLYQDVCSYDYPNNPHMHIQKLCELIQKSERKRVFCMHFDESFDMEAAKNLGFQLVQNFLKKL